MNNENNIISLPGHKGRHTDAYHNFVLCSLKELDTIASGDPALFIDGMRIFGQFVAEHPLIPYATYK